MNVEEMPTVNLGDVPAITALVAVVSKVAVVGSNRVVLAGGLAVMARLGIAHRSTSDVDAVIRDLLRTTELLRQIPGANSAGHVIIDNVKVDLIEVDPDVSWEAMEAVHTDDTLGSYFVVAHKLVFVEGSSVRLVAGTTTAEVPTGSTRSLLLAKLGAYLSPRRDRSKRSSDALDVWRLLEACRLGTLRATVGCRLDEGLPSLAATVGREMVQAVKSDPVTLQKRLAQLNEKPSFTDIDARCEAVIEMLEAPVLHAHSRHHNADGEKA